MTNRCVVIKKWGCNSWSFLLEHLKDIRQAQDYLVCLRTMQQHYLPGVCNCWLYGGWVVKNVQLSNVQMSPSFSFSLSQFIIYHLTPRRPRYLIEINNKEQSVLVSPHSKHRKNKTMWIIIVETISLQSKSPSS